MGKRTSSRVLAYVRVSTDEQRASGLGLADQRAVIEAAAIQRGWLDVEFVSDEGVSAKNLSRPGIAWALEQLATGEAGVLVVSKLDRLSRSLLDFANLMDTARRQGWELVALDLAIDTSTPSGALMANVMASFAEFERRLIGQRTSAALQAKKVAGARLGRPRALAPAIRERIVAERNAGGTLTGIANRLNADGIPTARGGRAWLPATVAAVLRSAALDREALARSS
ncbi:recombinase family protein [Blastococcus sp. DSM 46786]|uniref:recombinase family protein n=1 Tax=Blastococcus sp. DSM 46786 TaxID=1798227 RepID=UPI000B81DBCB|nr:recombinase family protein [Blastococcus sp. DSM 46786]